MNHHKSEPRCACNGIIPVVLDCPLPPGANPANARIDFVYDANDPGAIGQMTLAAAN
jgi:hypothetical protein